MSDSKDQFSDLENKNLEAHVELAKQRFYHMSKRLDDLDSRIDALIDDIEMFRHLYDQKLDDVADENSLRANEASAVIIKAAAAVIAGLLSTVVVVLVALL